MKSEIFTQVKINNFAWVANITILLFFTSIFIGSCIILFVSFNQYHINLKITLVSSLHAIIFGFVSVKLYIHLANVLKIVVFENTFLVIKYPLKFSSISINYNQITKYTSNKNFVRKLKLKQAETCIIIYNRNQYFIFYEKYFSNLDNLANNMKILKVKFED